MTLTTANADLVTIIKRMFAIANLLVTADAATGSADTQKHDATELRYRDDDRPVLS